MVDDGAPYGGNSYRSAEQAARRRCPHGDDKPRLNDLFFQIHQPAAAFDFVAVGTLVQAPFAARLKFKMFDRIGDKDLGAVEASFRERPIKHPPGGTDEGAALQILVVAMLLADEHEERRGRSLAGNDLSCGSV